MRNAWIIPVIERLEQQKHYGKLVLNFKEGEIPSIKAIEEDILKPRQDIGKEMS